MLTQQFSEGTSFVHRSRAGVKLLVLMVFCTLLLSIDSMRFTVVSAVLVACLYALAGVRRELIVDAIWPARWLLLILFVAQGLIGDWGTAVFVVLRLSVLILAASLLTLTTRSSDLIAALESVFARVLPATTASKISLAIALCLRFIPVVRQTFDEVQDAQRARGLGGNWRALATPTLLRTLQSADQIAEAITVRSCEPHTTSSGNHASTQDESAP